MVNTMGDTLKHTEPTKLKSTASLEEHKLFKVIPIKNRKLHKNKQ